MPRHGTSPSRNTQKKLLLDTLSALHQFLAILLFVITIGNSVGLLLLSPQVYEEHSHAVKSLEEFRSIMRRESRFQQDIKGLNALNREVLYQITLRKSPLLESLNFDLQYKVNVMLSEGYQMISDGESSQWRQVEVSCPRNAHFCDAATVLHLRAIPIPLGHTTQDMSVQIEFKGLDQMVSKDRMLAETLIGKFVVVSERYTWFEAVLRGIYVLTSIALFIVFAVVLLARQMWRRCKSEQKFILILLVSLIFFNNPLFFLDSFIASSTVRWFGSLLDVLFTATFMCFFLCFVMVMSHYVLVPPKERTICWFYLPKLLLTGLLWILLMIVLSWQRFREDSTVEGTQIGGTTEDASTGVNRNSSTDFTDPYNLLSYTLVSLMVVCFAALTYYVIRGVSDMSKRALTHNYSVRLRNFWALTLLVVLACVAFWALKLIGPASGLSTSLVFFPLFNYYALILVIFFSPSTVPETDLRELVIQEFEREQEMADRENLHEVGSDSGNDDLLLETDDSV